MVSGRSLQLPYLAFRKTPLDNKSCPFDVFLRRIIVSFNEKVVLIGSVAPHTSDVSLSHLNRPARSCLSTISSLSSAHLSSNTSKYFGPENISNSKNISVHKIFLILQKYFVLENVSNLWYFFEADKLQLGDLSVEVKKVEMPGEIMMVSLSVDILP